MKFTLSITLGDDAMLTGWDISKALRIVRQQLEDRFHAVPVGPTHHQNIKDANGNIIGTWVIKNA